jgi:cob(I)alamin adenosyltransferase
MIDDERLKALKMVSEAKATVDDALPTAKSNDEVKPLKELEHTLEEVEVDLVVTQLDESLSELEELKQHLIELTSEVDVNDVDLKDVVRKVHKAAKEISVVVDAARRVVTIPEKL